MTTRFHVGDGSNRVLFIAMFIMIMAVAMLGAATLYTVTRPTTKYRPLHVDLPQVIGDRNLDSNSVEDHLTRTTTFLLTAYKCNSGKTDLFVVKTATFERVGSGEQFQTNVLDTLKARVIPVGCGDYGYSYSIPLLLPAGIWRLRGQDSIRENNNVQTIDWYSEAFEVIQ